MPPGFACAGVREVHLDLHSFERRERVGERVRVMRERAGVDHDGRAATARPVDRVDQIALVVRLHVLDVVPELGGRFLRERDELVEGGRAVVLRFPLAEQIEVGTGAQQNLRHHASTPMAANALRTAPGSGASTRSIPFGPSSTKVRPPDDFLSRVMIVSRSSARRPAGAAVGRPRAATRPSVWATRSGGTRSRTLASWAANTSPIATASPCMSAWADPVSSAWPTVCP